MNIEYLYGVAPAQEAVMPGQTHSKHCDCGIMQHRISVEKAELETPGFGCYTLFSLK